MGEIADMHVDAYEAGLDPNEMDGADWADFYSGRETDVPPNPWLIWHEAGSFLEWIDDRAPNDHEGMSAVEVFSLYFPDVVEPEKVLEALRVLASHENPESADVQQQ
jgi:hypothetical protein